MLITLRNIAVNIMAAFIINKEARHRFRNRYKRKSKFRKLKDDNIRLFKENKSMREDIKNLRTELTAIRTDYDRRFNTWEGERSRIFRVAPLDFITPPPNTPSTDAYLAIVCVAKNEGPYLKEWIEFHKLVGVDRFYLYDNESDDNTKGVLESYINDGTVVYHFLPNHPITKLSPQVEAYNDAIFRYRDMTRWMAIIDADEFIVPVEMDSIPEFLADYERYPAVVANWVSFDSNGHVKRPSAHGGLLTANYTRVRKDYSKDVFVKSIVNPKQVVYGDVHNSLYYGNSKAVNENFTDIIGSSTKIHSVKKIRINHYRTKSKEECYEKLRRNYKGTPAAYRFTDSWINFKEETTMDFVIQKYVPQLKDVMKIQD